MPSRNRGHACDCCCSHQLSVLECSSTVVFGPDGFENVTTPPDPPGNLYSETYHETDTPDFNVGFTRESVSAGSLTVGGTIDTGYIGAESGTVQTARFDLTATVSGDGTAGWIFWDDAFSPVTLRNAHNGYQWRYLSGKMRMRNALRADQQFFEVSEQPIDGRPVVVMGLAFEFDGGQRGYAFDTQLTSGRGYGRCWNAIGVTGFASSGYHEFDSQGRVVQSASPFFVECFPGSSNAQLEKVGYFIGLSTWKGSPISSWTSLNVPSGTHDEEFFVGRVGYSSCWQNYCHCYHTDITSLNLFWDGGPTLVEPHLPANSIGMRNPIQIRGKTIPLTRSASDDFYSGSITVTGTAKDDVQTADISGFGFNASDLIVWKYGSGVAARASTPQRADSQNSVWESELAAISGIGGITVTGGPLHTNAITITTTGANLPNLYIPAALPQAVLRNQLGNAGNQATLNVELTIDPSQPSVSTGYLTRRENRSCSKLRIYAGFFEFTWEQVTPPPWFTPSQEPVLLAYEYFRSPVNFPSFPNTYIKQATESLVESDQAKDNFFNNYWALYRVGFDIDSTSHYMGWNIAIYE